MSPWLAGFVGDANVLPGRADGGSADTALGAVPLRAPANGPVEVLVRPEQVRLEPGGEAEVGLVEYYGHDTVYVLDVGGLLVRSREGGVPLHRPGDRVTAVYAGGPAVAWSEDPR